MRIRRDHSWINAYIGERIGKWKTFVSGESPGETGDRGEDVEERDEEDEGHHDDENVGGVHGLGRFPVDFDDGQAGWGVRDRINVPNAEHNSDHECPLHNAVQRHSRDHAVGNSGPWSVDFITYKDVSLKLSTFVSCAETYSCAELRRKR